MGDMVTIRNTTTGDTAKVNPKVARVMTAGTEFALVEGKGKAKAEPEAKVDDGAVPEGDGGGSPGVGDGGVSGDIGAVPDSGGSPAPGPAQPPRRRRRTATR